MCIVIIKRKNVDTPTKDVINTCFENNSDGAGIMYLTNDGVKISKGFMSLVKLNKYLDKKNFTKKDTVIYHFRLATHGLTAKGQTHPFPISEIDRDLMSTEITTDLGMAHNGVLSAMQSDKILSDTMMYTKHILFPIKDMIFTKKMKGLLDKSSVGSRLVFLNKKGRILTIGNWVQDKGLMYSNNGYQEKNWITQLDDDNPIVYDDCVDCEICGNISYSIEEDCCYECYRSYTPDIDIDDFYRN